MISLTGRWYVWMSYFYGNSILAIIDKPYWLAICVDDLFVWLLYSKCSSFWGYHLVFSVEKCLWLYNQHKDAWCPNAIVLELCVYIYTMAWSCSHQEWASFGHSNHITRTGEWGIFHESFGLVKYHYTKQWTWSPHGIPHSPFLVFMPYYWCYK